MFFRIFYCLNLIMKTKYNLKFLIFIKQIFQIATVVTISDSLKKIRWSKVLGKNINVELFRIDKII